MKAILEFILPDEADEHRVALEGCIYLAALDDLREAFRQHRKYDAEPVTEDRFFTILKDRDIVI